MKRSAPWVRAAMWVLAGGWCAAGSAAQWSESPMLEARVANGTLPPIHERLPANPHVTEIAGPGRTPGRFGGDLTVLMGRAKDVRLMVVYGYARLLCYDERYDLVPDILEKVEQKDGREFTLSLRQGHRWSDGQPFTSEDFRYYWEDIATNAEISKFGPPKTLVVDGALPEFEVIDETTVRYRWAKPNPYFLPALAGARPEFIYAPAHYLKQFHASYQDVDALNTQAKAQGQRNWVAVHVRRWRPYKNINPDLPSLQPWVNTTKPPSQRFVFERNAFYHRVDEAGKQLPYIDRVVMNIADGKLIPAKAGAGESDLQARSIKFSDYTFLKESEKRTGNKVLLWETTKGSHMALFPNLNVVDPAWRKLVRDVRFRRALSLAINRNEINQLIYYGLAKEGNDTVHQTSPLFKPEYRAAWAAFDTKKANALLDELGLTKRGSDGVRLLPDGRPMEIIVTTAGEDTEQTDVLELIRSTWRDIGIKLFSKPMQREVFRNRIFSGDSLMAVWGGLENGLPTADMSPHELAPTNQVQLQWPRWGQFYETQGDAGEPIELPAAVELAELNEQWLSTTTRAQREKIWHRMLEIRADQAFSIGLVAGVLQPVVVDAALRNVPKKGIYNWEPGAHFGIYRPDTFWFAAG